MSEYISRAAAYNAIVNNYTTDAQLRDLDEIPAADVAPVRHGRWVDEKYVWQGQKSAKCNQCKKKTGYYIQPKYCPSCGAKMDGGKDDA